MSTKFPDLAYPIETLYANLKKIKNRNPKDYEKLKQFCIEEWNKINHKIISKIV